MAKLSFSPYLPNSPLSPTFMGPLHCFVFCLVGDCGKIVIFAIFAKFAAFPNFYGARILLCAFPRWRLWQNCHFRHICQVRQHYLFFAIFVVVCISGHISFYEEYIILVTHPNTNPAQQGLTSVNFGITKLSDGSEGTLKLVVKRSLSTCQPRSQCFSLPIYFLRSFWVQYFASNHMSSQTQDFYHGTTMIDNTKTTSCTVRATYYARTGLFRRTNV